MRNPPPMLGRRVVREAAGAITSTQHAALRVYLVAKGVLLAWVFRFRGAGALYVATGVLAQWYLAAPLVAVGVHESLRLYAYCGFTYCNQLRELMLGWIAAAYLSTPLLLMVLFFLLPPWQRERQRRRHCRYARSVAEEEEEMEACRAPAEAAAGSDSDVDTPAAERSDARGGRHEAETQCGRGRVVPREQGECTDCPAQQQQRQCRFALHAWLPLALIISADARTALLSLAFFARDERLRHIEMLGERAVPWSAITPQGFGRPLWPLQLARELATAAALGVPV